MSKKDAQLDLVPRLRFPEFKNAPAWLGETVGDRCTSSFSGGTPDTSNSAFYNGDIPFIRSAEIGKNRTKLHLTESGLSSSAAKMVQRGDLLVALYGANSGDVALATTEGAINQAIICLRTNESAAFLYHYLTARKTWIIATYLQGGQGNLSGDIVKSVSLHFPSPKEQQKVADSLGSLDELIEAEARKLQALGDHKKGLMQQLFPREGQTRPQRRFSEFNDAPEWEAKKAGNLFGQRKEKGEPGLPIYSVTINNGMVLRSTFDRNFYDIEDPAGNKKANKNDITYNMMRMWQGACGVAPEDCMVSPAYVVLKPKTGTCSAFFGVLFKRSATLQLLMAYSRGLTLDRLRLYFDDFTSIPLLVPTEPEQRRIADCLSSLDENIVVQTEKLNALRTHKCGLMQQLFPAPEDHQ